MTNLRAISAFLLGGSQFSQKFVDRNDPSGFLVRVNIPWALSSWITDQKRRDASPEEKACLPVGSEHSPYSIFAENRRRNRPNVRTLKVSGVHLCRVPFFKEYVLSPKIVDVL
jgi:hypothetical protein